MKKKFILSLGLVTTFAMTYTLVACGPRGGTSGNSETSTTATASRISLNRTNLKDHYVVGDTLDLSQFVKIADSDNKTIEGDISSYYTVTLSKNQELATLDGNELTLEAEGEIDVKYELVGTTKSATLTINSVSEIKGLYLDYISDIGSNYAIQEAYVDNKGIYNYGDVTTTIIHNDNYFSIPRSENKEFKGYYGIVGGTDNESYEFNIDKDYNGTLQVKPGPTGASINQYYFTQKLPFGKSDVTTKTGQDSNGNLVEYLELSLETTKTFVSYGLGVDIDSIAAQGYTLLPGEIQFAPEFTFISPNGTEEKIENALMITTFVTGPTQNGGTGTLYLSFPSVIAKTPENVTIPSIEKWRTEVGAPEPYKDPGVANAINYLAAAKSYKELVESGWVDVNGEYVTSAPDGSGLAQGTDWIKYYTVFGTKGNNNASKVASTIYKTENELGYEFTTFESKNELVGVKTLFTGSGEKTTKKTNLVISNDTGISRGDTFASSEIASSIDKATPAFSVNSSSLNSNFNIGISDITTKTNEDKSTTTTVNSSSSKYLESFIGGLIDSTPLITEGLLASYTEKSLTNSNKEQVSVASFLSNIDISFTTTGSGDSLKYTSIQVDAYLIYDSSNNMIYKWSMSFSDFNNTTIPTDFAK